MTKKVLITGVAGFIGSHVAEACLAEGWNVEGVDDMSNGHKEFVHKDVSLIECDFADPIVLSDIKAKKYDYVFHLAANARVPYSVEHPVESNDNNVTKTLKLIEACKGSIERFIFSSSCSVYGNANKVPTPEDERSNPLSPYALQKLIIEQYLRLYADLYKFDSICLRYFNVYGPRQIGGSPYATAVGNWLSAIINKEPLRFDGDGSQRRDLVFVEDVAQANVKAAAYRPYCAGNDFSIFNVGSGTNISNSEIVRMLGERFNELTIRYAPVRAGDVKVTLAEIGRALALLHYDPQYTFEQGLKRTIEWALATPYMKTMRSSKG